MIQGICENEKLGKQWTFNGSLQSLEQQLRDSISAPEPSYTQADGITNWGTGVPINGDPSDWEYHAWKREVKCGDTVIKSPSGLSAWVNNPIKLTQAKLTARHHKALAKVEKAFELKDPQVCRAVELALHQNPQYKKNDVALWHVALEDVHERNKEKGYRVTRMPLIIPPSSVRDPGEPNDYLSATDDDELVEGPVDEEGSPPRRILTDDEVQKLKIW
jgi:hypothetical protein